MGKVKEKRLKMGNRLLKDFEVMQKVLQLTCDTLLVLDKENICRELILKTSNPVINERAEILGKNFIQLLPFPLSSEIEREIQYVRSTGEVSNANYDLPTDDGMYYFKLIVQRLDEDYVICQYRDITQRSNMKRRLKSALTAQLEVGKVARINLWSINMDSGVISFSGFSNLQQRHIQEPQEITLEKLLSAVHPDDRTRLEKFLFERQSVEKSIEYRLKMGDRPIEYIRATKYSCRTEQGQLIVDGFTQNISDFLKNRNELEMVLSVVYNAPFSIHANHLDGRMVFANKECRMQNKIPMGLDVTNLSVNSVLQNFASQKSWDELIEEINHNNGINRYRCDHAYPDMDIIGSECYSFIVQNGIGQEIVWTIRRDISDQIRYEQQLLQSKEAAETSEKLKSAFISNMNHEIRTPLSAIIGFSNIIAETPDPILRKEYGKILSSNSTQLLRLVTDVLEMSEMESGKINLLPENVSLNGILSELSLSFGELKNCASIRFHLAPQDAVLNMDRVRIIQLLTNLINNALKFTPPDGLVNVGYELFPNQVRFYVADSGIGIAKEKQQAIFDRFYKVDERYHGSGLGLAICRSIVNQMDGRIWVESREGEGATFFIEIPIANV